MSDETKVLPEEERVRTNALRVHKMEWDGDEEVLVRSARAATRAAHLDSVRTVQIPILCLDSSSQAQTDESIRPTVFCASHLGPALQSCLLYTGFNS